jgi:ferredoxin
MKIVVDPTRCDAFGFCAELLGEVITLDEWGFPIVAREISDGLRAAAEEAARSCPRRALRLAAKPAPRS